MNFIEAVKLAKKDEKIGRRYNDYVLYLDTSKFLCHFQNDTPYICKYADIIADDWEVVEINAYDDILNDNRKVAD